MEKNRELRNKSSHIQANEFDKAAKITQFGNVINNTGKRHSHAKDEAGLPYTISKN